MFVDLLLAFAGGIFASVIGGTISFLLTGFLALIAIAIILGGGGEAFMDEIVFGAFFGPHIAFAGAAAAAAVAGRFKERYETQKENEVYSQNTNHQVVYVDGNDVNTPIFATKNATALLVGGLFGVFGYIFNHFLVTLQVPIDTVATTVVVSGILARLIVARDSIFKKQKVDNHLAFDLVWGTAYAGLTAFAVQLTGINTIGWAISAFTLIFLFTTASNFPVSHHISMVAGHAMIAYQNIWIASLFGMGAVVLGHYTNQYTNTNMKSHLDMPAVVIAIGSMLTLPFM